MKLYLICPITKFTMNCPIFFLNTLPKMLTITSYSHAYFLVSEKNSSNLKYALVVGQVKKK
jgi:hypothetical protein